MFQERYACFTCNGSIANRVPNPGATTHLLQLTVFNALNEDMIEYGQQGMFCSLCYVILDLKTGEMSTVNAGHLPALWWRNHKTEYCFHPSGPPLGILPDAEWKEDKDILSKGEAILLFTDGIIEARKEEKGKEITDMEFGIDRLKKLVETQQFENTKDFVCNILRKFKNILHQTCLMMTALYCFFGG